jgi:hypothetical protein
LNNLNSCSSQLALLKGELALRSGTKSVGRCWGSLVFYVVQTGCPQQLTTTTKKTRCLPQLQGQGFEPCPFSRPSVAKHTTIMCRVGQPCRTNPHGTPSALGSRAAHSLVLHPPAPAGHLGDVHKDGTAGRRLPHVLWPCA